MTFRKIKNFFRKYRGEWIIASATTLLSILISGLIKKFLNVVNPVTLILIAIGFIVIFLLLGILFNLKRLFDVRFSQVNRILIDQFGFYTPENQYLIRSRHFPLEKMKLANSFVKKTLPKLIKHIFDNNGNITKLNIIFDSGTTITPIFKFLTEYDHKFDKGKIRIFTNNLAGIDEIHKFGSIHDSQFSLSEKDFNLIGGRPLLKYRATTGDITNDFLNLLQNEQDRAEGIILTLGVLTSNWFVVGRDYDKILLCARGAGHYEFKKKVEEISQYIVLISPLGKILPLRNVNELNRYITDDEYDAFAIPDEKKDSTFLLTTFRKKKTLSPLVNLSMELEKIMGKNSAKNYSFFGDKILFKPISGTKAEIRNVELPHDYISDNFRDIYGYEMP